MTPHDARARFDRGIELFNLGEYFECHEVLEEIWTPAVNPERRFLQSLIHFAVGMYHHRRDNPAGAFRQLSKGLRKIQDYLPEWDGIDTSQVERDLRSCLRTVECGGKIDPPPSIRRA